MEKSDGAFVVLKILENEIMKLFFFLKSVVLTSIFLVKYVVDFMF